MARSDSQTNKPQYGCPKKTELLDVILNINTGAQAVYIVGAQVADWLAHWPLANVA